MEWDRQSGESYPAFEAFKIYLNLSPRTYQKVATAVDKSLTLIKRWAKNHHWRDRADAWDSELQRQSMEKAADEYAAMIARHINVGKLLQAKAANAISQMDLSSLPPKFLPALANMIKIGAQLERNARELSNEGNTSDNLFAETLNKIYEKHIDD